MPSTTPDTIAYMVLGYAAAIIIMLGLTAYLYMRSRRLKGELALLKQLEDEDKS